MAAQHGVQPALGQEDVAGSPHLFEQIEPGPDPRLCVRRVQGVMQPAQAVNDPRLAPAVRGVADGREERLAGGRVGRERRRHERQRGATVRRHGASHLRGDQRIAIHVPNGEVARQGDQLRLPKRQPRQRCLTGPQLLQPLHGGRGRGGGPQTGEAGGGEAGRFGPLEACTQRGLQRRRRLRSLRVSEEGPDQPLDAGEQTLQVELARLG